MDLRAGERRDPIQIALAAVVFLVSFVVYAMTVQRTVPFWDCGEFITCAYILGIPHPPGTPLFVLIGKMFSLFPIGSDPSLRINLISSLASALSASVAYVVAVWLIRKWFSSSEAGVGWRRVTIHVGALVGAFYFAFGRTNWSNAVEAEVYGVSMLFMMLTIYLALLWVDHRSDARGEAYLVLMSYLGTLALGVHMTSYIVIPLAFLMMLLVEESYRTSWQIWVTFIVLCLVVYDVQPFLIAASSWAAIACMAYYWRKMNHGWIYTLALPILAIVVLSLSGKPFVPVYVSSIGLWALLSLAALRMEGSAAVWRISLTAVLAALLGYSVQLFIPIRAAEKPAMNMNAPDNWEAFKGFLERKQYGSENMITRMFTRRGEWKNQFGTHPRMGFWGFLREQYGFTGRLFALPFFLGLFGMYYAARKHWKSGLFVFLIVLACTVGLVLYMNFADGTREDKVLGEGHLEVRDRDYFWTPGFIMFGLMIGVGLAALFDMLRMYLETRKFPQRAKDAVLGAFCITLLLPISAIANNYFVNDRSRNYFAYDYAWNLLQSARPGAVLFTNGDNDTFPVWCLQYVYGVRPDVKIANLSLINTDWYGIQLKDELGVPIGLSERQIQSLRHVRTQDGVFRVQDQMIADIIDQNQKNKNQIPIQFAITVSSANKNYRGKQLDPYLQMEGMALTSYYPKEQPAAVDIEKTHDMYWNQFRFRGVTDTTIYKDENAARLVNNYISGFLFVADTLQRAGRVDEAAAEVYKGMELVGSDSDAWGYLSRMYALHDRIDDAKRVLQEAPPNVDRDRLKLFLAAALKDKGRTQEARQLLEEVYASSPDSRDAFTELFRFYYDERMQYELADLLESYSLRHPEDKQIRDAYDQLKKDAPELFAKRDTTSVVEPEAAESLEHGRKVSVVGVDSAAQGAAPARDSSTGR